MKQRQSWLSFPMVLMLLLLLLSQWLRTVIEGSVPEQRSAKNDVIDSYAIDTRSLRFDGDGNKSYTLMAKRAEHFPEATGSRLFDVVLIWHRRDGQTELSARTAEVLSDYSQVTVTGDVRMRQSVAGSPEWLATTERAVAWPDQGLVRGDRPVVVDQGGSTMTARGFEADQNAKTMTFAGRVVGDYRP